ncbi:S-adenosyl-L-methionine-dependent methyltransferase [Kalaharituber pfeilii]|nr:S-adenosyl-L-methionine-dependent methyltransferase [Kalaharituber pfeilii]
MQFRRPSPEPPLPPGPRLGRPGAAPCGRVYGGAGHTAPQTLRDKDHIVQQTDIDASGSRLAAVNTGYLDDPYASLLHGGGESDRPRRFPLINRGTYTRTTAIDELAIQFLRSIPPKQKKQIVSLGAGSDTRYWRFKGYGQDWADGLIYHELDFGEVSRRKAERIEKWGLLSNPLKTTGAEAGDSGSHTATLEGGQQKSSPTVTIDAENGSVSAPDYYLHPIDIRTIQPGLPTSPLPDSIDTGVPTLIISECCLIYLSPTEADAILTFFTTTFRSCHPLAIVLYEPIGSDDAFGKVMIQNLATRGIVLQTLKKYSTLSKQRERLRVLGFKGGQASGDVDWIWETWVSQNEKERLARLEMLDEVEEWKLLAKHYCVVWGWADADGNEVEWEGWKDIPNQDIDM